MTTHSKRWLGLIGLALGISMAGLGGLVSLTWPNNLVGVYLTEQRNRAANIRALEWRLTREMSGPDRQFFQAWLDEEKGNLKEAILGFRSLRDGATPGSPMHLKSALRLGLAYGMNREPDRELATYQELMGRHPGPSRLSQATYHLRRGERDQARRLLDDALARDAQDGSLGSYRPFAQGLRNSLGPSQSHALPSP